MSGHPGEELLAVKTAFITFGSLAVEVFFIISGYLITRSLLRRNNLIDFAEARILRIFPALVVCCALSAFVLGPIATSLGLADYLTNKQTWNYFFQNSSLINLNWFLPGVFENNIHKGVVNGSIWTLPTELKMYVIFFGLGIVSFLFKRYRQFGLAMLIGSYLIYCFATQEPQLASHISADPKPLVAFFSSARIVTFAVVSFQFLPRLQFFCGQRY